MPRPNQPRTVLAERNLAQRIAYEREKRQWTYEGLAERMTAAGCAMTPSAVYKIERAGRRIVGDEVVAFGQVFGLTEHRLYELFLPPATVRRQELSGLLVEWQHAFGDARRALEAMEAAYEALLKALDDDEQLRTELVSDLDATIAGIPRTFGWTDAEVLAIAAFGVAKSTREIDEAIRSSKEED